MSMPAYNFPSVSIAGDKLQVYNSYKYKDALKQIGCRWSPEEKAWWIAATPENFRKLLAVPGWVNKSYPADDKMAIAERSNRIPIGQH